MDEVQQTFVTPVKKQDKKRFDVEVETPDKTPVKDFATPHKVRDKHHEEESTPAKGYVDDYIQRRTEWAQKQFKARAR